MTHICVSNLTIIGSDNGLSPARCQAIIYTNAGISLIRTIGKNFSEILSEISTFPFKKMHLKMSSGKRWPICLGLNVLNVLMEWVSYYIHCTLWDVITHPCPDRHLDSYRQTSNIRRIKSQNLNISRLVLPLSLSNPLKPGVKSRMKM